MTDEPISGGAVAPIYNVIWSFALAFAVTIMAVFIMFAAAVLGYVSYQEFFDYWLVVGALCFAISGAVFFFASYWVVGH